MRTATRSLTAVEARERAGLVTVASYDVDLDLTGDEDTFRSVSTVRFHTPSGAATFLDVKPRQLRQATLNGVDLDIERMFDSRDGRLRLDGLDDDNELVIDAVMAYSHDGEGLHRHVDPADGKVYLYAMSFLSAAPRWFACFDQPDLKAPVRLSVACPPSWTVVGNGPAHQLEPGRWQLEATEPLATYFTTLVAGPYHSLRAEHDGIPLGLHARASLAAHLDRDAEELFDFTSACFDEFHRLFGIRYPWGEYHQAFVPDFNAGAMENPGCVTFRDLLVFRSQVTDAQRARRATTIAHEMAHMWFGNLVTMRWWDDLWLNESFAEYLGHRVCDTVSEHRSWIEFGIERKAWGYAADRRPSTHPVAGNGAADAASALSDFDGISYAKGAALLRQLAARLGDDVFFDGVRRHFRAHRFGNADFADLISAWTAAGAPDTAEWAQQWLRTAGLDTIRAVPVDGVIQVQRLHPADAPAARPHAIAVTAFADGGERASETRLVLDSPTATAPTHPAPSLVLPDADDETWAKIALDDTTWHGMPMLLPTLDATARVVVWNALRLAVADAEIDPRLAVDIVVAALPVEPEQAVIANIARWFLGPLTGAYLPNSEARSDALGRAATALLPALEQAPPSSSRQLALARAFAGCSSDVHDLRGWLSGAAPAGLVMDADLRWLVLQRLAALGALSSADIERELTADNSSDGRVQAAKCHALRPDHAAKERAWRVLMGDPGRPNYELYAMAEGFWHPLQGDLTDAYVARYLDEIAGTATLRSGWVVGRVAQLAYPWTAVTASTLAGTEELLARDDLDRQIRREVLDAGDDLRRALAARTRFAAESA